MELINSFYDGWRDLMDNKSDQRTTDWPLMSSPLPTAAICLTYAYCVKVLGPKLMENRKPFKLREVLIVYNFLQVCLSTWIFYEACMAGWLTGYSYRCEQIDRSRNPVADRMAATCWLYYISKFTELLDTIFFVLRKRNDQISTLHIVHHGIMPFSVWWGVKFISGGHGTFFGFINSFVHIVMYTYYMLAAMGPAVQKYLWWKKYLTVLQMTQFVFVFLHAFQLLLWNPCGYPLVFVAAIAAHAVMFYFLFRNYYDQEYKKKVKKEKECPELKSFSKMTESNNNSKYERRKNVFGSDFGLRDRILEQFHN